MTGLTDFRINKQSPKDLALYGRDMKDISQLREEEVRGTGKSDLTHTQQEIGNYETDIPEIERYIEDPLSENRLGADFIFSRKSPHGRIQHGPRSGRRPYGGALSCVEAPARVIQEKENLHLRGTERQGFGRNPLPGAASFKWLITGEIFGAP